MLSSSLLIKFMVHTVNRWNKQLSSPSVGVRLIAYKIRKWLEWNFISSFCSSVQPPCSLGAAFYMKFVRKFPLAIYQTNFAQTPSKIDVKTNRAWPILRVSILTSVRIFIPRYREGIRLIRSFVPEWKFFPTRKKFAFHARFIDRDTEIMSEE